MYCRKCRYPLLQAPGPACPECGRAFDPDDPRSYAPTSRSPRLRIAIAALAAVALFGVFQVLSKITWPWEADPWQPYTQVEFDAARARGDRVVVFFTADWDAACQPLERYFRGREFRSLAWRNDLAPLRIDITGANPAGAFMLQNLGSAAIPTVAVYDGEGPVTVLSGDAISPDDVRDLVRWASAGRSLVSSISCENAHAGGKPQHERGKVLQMKALKLLAGGLLGILAIGSVVALVVRIMSYDGTDYALGAVAGNLTFLVLATGGSIVLNRSALRK